MLTKSSTVIDNEIVGYKKKYGFSTALSKTHSHY